MDSENMALIMTPLFLALILLVMAIIFGSKDNREVLNLNTESAIVEFSKTERVRIYNLNARRDYLEIRGNCTISTDVASVVITCTKE